jgi:MarR family transcriptional regulator, organic hydroperoxide resistance regulator
METMAKPNIGAMAREVDRDLRAIRQFLRRPLEAAIVEGGLTGPQQSAMEALVRSDGLSLKELSRELGLAHSTVSGIVDRLEARGMVERRTDDRDQRATSITVTGQVRDWLRNAMPALGIQPLDQALRAATPAERQTILEGVRALREVLERSAV